MCCLPFIKNPFAEFAIWLVESSLLIAVLFDVMPSSLLGGVVNGEVFSFKEGDGGRSSWATLLVPGRAPVFGFIDLSIGGGARLLLRLD